MRNKILSWAQEKTAKLRGRKAGAKQCQDGPKELWSPWASRTIALTPTTSSTDLGPPVLTAMSASAFFLNLPAEIRRKILIAAFGDRTMHMSLEYNHPRQLRSPRRVVLHGQDICLQARSIRRKCYGRMKMSSRPGIGVDAPAGSWASQTIHTMINACRA